VPAPKGCFSRTLYSGIWRECATFFGLYFSRFRTPLFFSGFHVGSLLEIVCAGEFDFVLFSELRRLAKTPTDLLLVSPSGRTLNVSAVSFFFLGAGVTKSRSPRRPMWQLYLGPPLLPFVVGQFARDFYSFSDDRTTFSPFYAEFSFQCPQRIASPFQSTLFHFFRSRIGPWL